MTPHNHAIGQYRTKEDGLSHMHGTHYRKGVVLLLGAMAALLLGGCSFFSGEPPAGSTPYTPDRDELLIELD